MKNISILGSTGSIGKQALDVVRYNREKFKVVALSANKSIDMLADQIEEFRPELVSIGDEKSASQLQKIVNQRGIKGVDIASGQKGLNAVAAIESAQVVLTAVVGIAGLIPTIEAINKGKDIALSNKETMVTAGNVINKLAKEKGSSIIPVDSEHSAIFQCLNGEDMKSIKRLILTASGGPFRGRNREDLVHVKKEAALKHPNWSMGQKISIDSATLMNKGLEVIEAKWLFDVDMEKIDVVVHPQSIIHSMVEFEDSSIIAQMGNPDMRIPIQYAFSYPQRLKSNFESLDFTKISSLTFEKPDKDTFPCLELAYDSLRSGGTHPAVLNGANEVLVEEYLNGRIGFYDIPKYVQMAMDCHNPVSNPGVEDILEADRWVRDYIHNELAGIPL
ncbi:1-deoxy-D-xylulose 5-phosphate reductoisomerase [Peptoclostridium litorale DSM 5388]|uniref:1-deoxy-D-xylulose 5-phosphate reductoisomerase n=1 Tax=Peptoclostridium litorale DSM 5388 TaxID=1121324 RepID=A0A069RDQ4_PEPLI|nr:1-deoxy-D-xylulose-5-phosphate reductoisomerase [Peptoclostridium litorale]KDR95199.1 1-deoxy-D-xylulose 5-phosphate reductoisomerase Dxr [Peptoclostridium litorale DSM 5388]SIN73485.1 1-deoxy-D-xylulose 5-phosphate reductoisomerase [Peptoclostridium litorale DSM 5388]